LPVFGANRGALSRMGGFVQDPSKGGEKAKKGKEKSYTVSQFIMYKT